MFSFNGIGTTIYGRRDFDPKDKSYTVTKWFTIFFLPIIPLGSYRVIKVKQEFLTPNFPQYHMRATDINIPQIIFTYLVAWCIPLTLFIIALFF